MVFPETLLRIPMFHMNEVETVPVFASSIFIFDINYIIGFIVLRLFGNSKILLFTVTFGGHIVRP